MSKAVYDFPRRYGIRSYTSIRNVFRSLVKASQIVKDVDLQDKVAIITGANSGLGIVPENSMCMCEYMCVCDTCGWRVDTCVCVCV